MSRNREKNSPCEICANERGTRIISGFSVCEDCFSLIKGVRTKNEKAIEYFNDEKNVSRMSDKAKDYIFILLGLKEQETENQESQRVNTVFLTIIAIICLIASILYLIWAIYYYFESPKGDGANIFFASLFVYFSIWLLIYSILKFKEKQDWVIVIAGWITSAAISIAIGVIFFPIALGNNSFFEVMLCVFIIIGAPLMNGIMLRGRTSLYYKSNENLGEYYQRIEDEKAADKALKVRLKQNELQDEYKQALDSQQSDLPWSKRYFTEPCPYCGHYKVRYSTWDDKKVSVAFWGLLSSKIGQRFHCDYCNKDFNN